MKFLICLFACAAFLLADIRFTTCETQGTSQEIEKTIAENCNGETLIQTGGAVYQKRGQTLIVHNPKTKEIRIYDHAKKTYRVMTLDVAKLHSQLKELQLTSNDKTTTSFQLIDQKRQIDGLECSGYRMRFESKMKLSGDSTSELSTVMEQEFWTSPALAAKLAKGMPQIPQQEAAQPKASGVGAMPALDFATESLLNLLGVNPESLQKLSNRPAGFPVEVKMSILTKITGMPDHTMVTTTRFRDFRAEPIPATEFVEPSGYTEEVAPQLPKQ